jgi:alpha-N-arabinofuranosidase
MPLTGWKSMKMRIAVVTAAVMWAGFGTSGAQNHESTTPQAIVANVDAAQTAQPVSKYEFGMFIEHIGPLIYRSLWSEMLDDRKFYFPITSAEPATLTGQQGGPLRMQLRKWHLVGPDSAVTMDKNQPFVGDQSPRIQLDASASHGIRQRGLSLVKGKKYTGRIWLRGTPGSKVTVSLDWGSGSNDRQTVSIPSLTTGYKKFPSPLPPGPTPVMRLSKSPGQAPETSILVPSPLCRPIT